MTPVYPVVYLSDNERASVARVLAARHEANRKRSRQARHPLDQFDHDNFEVLMMARQLGLGPN